MRTEKDALDLFVDWPFSIPEQLAGLMGGVTCWRAIHVLRSLHNRSQVQAKPDRDVLTD